MKKLFSNKEAEHLKKIDELKSDVIQLSAMVQAKDRVIGDLQAELETQGKRLVDALDEKDHQAAVLKTVDHDAINEQLRLAKTETKEHSAAAAQWQVEAKKAYRARDNAKAGFARLKKKIGRLETS